MRTARIPIAGLALVTAAVWVALLRLAVAFLSTSLDWTYVAEQSRVGAPWYYRLAGVWGGMEGSLLLFTGIVAVAALLAARRASADLRWAALMSVLALVLTDLVLSSPFRRLRVPATIGFGLNPILEHPAMAIHPPLLYAGLACSAGAAISAAGADHPWAAARRWLLACIALLTAAMTLGAAWSYMEQDWGGYWAWDPVENTSLLVWMGALVAVHAGPRARRRGVLGVSLAPWVIALLGGALVRSGRTPSVHGFAEQLDVGWTMFALAAATGAASVFVVLRVPREVRRADGDPRQVTVLLASIAATVVLVGTVAPVLTDLVSDRSSAVRGEFFSRTVGPLAAAAVPFLVWHLWTTRRRAFSWSTVAHVGALVVMAGIGASTFDANSTAPLAPGATLRAAGIDVTNRGLDVGAGPRVDTQAVTATLDVGGREMRPSLVVYPDRGGRLAEVAVRTGPWTDVHAVLADANDNGTVVVTIRRRHGMWLVWLGALVLTLAAAMSARSAGSRE